jgi:hypothetical protein
MAKYVLLDSTVYLDGKDLSGDSNAITVTAESDEVDVTNFGSSGTREFLAGLKSFSAQLQGFTSHATGAADPTLFTQWGVSDAIFSASAEGDDGDIGFFTKSVEMSLQPWGGAVGEASKFDASFRGRGQPLVRGTILHPGDTARTSTATGTGRQLGAVSATQKVYATLHVLSVSGTSSPTLTVKVQSDDNAGFTSATDRITFTGATAAGAQWATPVSGAITDDYWRATYTISGTNPSFLFAVLVGIQ